MKKLVLILFLVLSFSLVLAIDQSVSINYNFVNDSIVEKNLEFDSVLLKINTEFDMVCKYSSTKDVDYFNMVGNFDETGGKIHKKSLMDLLDGTYRYYIKCSNDSYTLHEPGELEVILRINSLVTGQILLSENSPLKAGDIEVTLVTSKVVSQAPVLTYSVDGISYKPVVLIGSEKNWKGYLVLENSLKEGVLSFVMKAVDLEGRQGTEIITGTAFPYDTIKPNLIIDIEAISYEGKIKLEWHLDEDIERFKIYRSTLQNPGYIDYYKTVESDEYTDTNVEDGETYYYRVAAVDEAGNEADLSFEVSGTSLMDDSEIEGGLDPSLRGKVDSFILEISGLEDEINLISTSSFNSKEKNLFDKLKLMDKVNAAKNELISLESSVEKFKSQDLTRDELDQKIESSRVKLEIIEKNVPSELFIVEESSRIEIIDEEFIMNALNKINPLLTTKEKDESVKQTLKLIEDTNLKVESNFYGIEVAYLDGLKKTIFVVERNLNSELEKNSNSYFVEIISSKIIEDGNIIVKNLDYDFLSDEVLTFGADNKNIFYYVEGISDLNDLKNIEFGFISIFEEEINSGNSITGFSIFNGNTGKFTWIIVLVFVMSVMAYFVYSRMNDFSDDYFRILNKINGGLDLLNKKEINKSKKVYFEVKDIYKNLKSNEKQNIYSKIENLYNDISISEMELGLEELKKTKDKKLLEKLEKMYEALSLLHKNKISVLFEKIKGEVENEK
jgi:hypothetical protein